MEDKVDAEDKWKCTKCGKITHLVEHNYDMGFCEFCGANLLPQYLKSLKIRPCRVFFEGKPEEMDAKAWEMVKKLRENAKTLTTRRGEMPLKV